MDKWLEAGCVFPGYELLTCGFLKNAVVTRGSGITPIHYEKKTSEVKKDIMEQHKEHAIGRIQY